MNKIKWIISDLDGTLLSHDEHGGKFSIDKDTINEINKAIDANIHFTIATGRHAFDALNIIKPIINSPKNSFVVGLNGGHIFSLDENKFIYESFIDSSLKTTLNDLHSELAKTHKDILFFAYCENQQVIFIENNSKHFEELVDHAVKFEQNESVIKYSKIDSILNLPKILKVCMKFYDKFSDPWPIVKQCKEFSDDFDYIPSGDVYIEILPKGISKGKAIDFINDRFYKLNKDEIIIFGDSGNDLDMFTRASISVTRDCAQEYVKEKVTHIYQGGASTFIHNAIIDLIENTKK